MGFPIFFKIGSIAYLVKNVCSVGFHRTNNQRKHTSEPPRAPHSPRRPAAPGAWGRGGSELWCGGVAPSGVELNSVSPGSAWSSRELREPKAEALRWLLTLSSDSVRHSARRGDRSP